ncbi:MAG: hypothetical protein QXS91_00825 [Candidatus Anstonellales archaeon]
MFLHIDIDAFFPSAERLRNKNLVNKPVVVCMFTRKGKSGAVASCSYEARKLGIKSGMPLHIAKRLATEDTVFLQADKVYYSNLSERVMTELSYFGNVEIASIDEAYINLGDVDDGYALNIASNIKKHIKTAIGLDVTIGIGKTRILAKMASKIAKPNGLKFVGSINDLADFDITMIPGVGKNTADYLKNNGINNIKNLIDLGPIKIKEMFPNKYGDYISAIILDNEPSIMRKKFKNEEQKQKGRITTLEQNTINKDDILNIINRLANELINELENDILISNITIMLIDKNMKTMTKSKKINPTRNIEIINGYINEMLGDIKIENEIRRAGIFFSDFIKAKQKTITEW